MKIRLGCLLLSVMLPLSASAHHGTSGQFDPTKIVEVGGVITKMAFVNPHAYVYFDVVESDGQTVNWNCELRASSVMRRSGWTKEMFAVGTKIEIVGVASRKDAKGCYVETISFNGSAPIKRYDQITSDSLKPIDTARPLVTEWDAPHLAGDWAATQRLHGQITTRNATKVGIDELEEIVTSGELETQERRRRFDNRIRYTASGKAYAERQTAAADNNTGRLDCKPRDVLDDWTKDQPTNLIVQSEDTITLKYGFMDTIRTVHLNQEAFPETLEPSWEGYSIGKWQGSSLIVTTRGFTQGGSAREGYHSADYNTVERYTLAGDGLLSIQREWESFDPSFWTDGYSASDQDIVYLSEVPFEPYNCDDRSVE